LIAIESRHHDVDENYVGIDIDDFGKRVKTVRRGRNDTPRFSQKGFCRTSYCITVVYDEHFKALNIHFITIVKPLNASSTVNVTQDVEF